ncbi:MAG: DEAD/DEAH box helicase [Propioniciclava sp.]
MSAQSRSPGTDTPPLRRHQREALTALTHAWAAGRTRAWVVMPPGSGKTQVGLSAAINLLDSGQVQQAVVLSPNTAIQQQWLVRARAAGLLAGTDRDVAGQLTSLTYQGLAVFDPDAEVDEDAEQASLLSRLHPNGSALLHQLHHAGNILLILDECHHLLEVWGRLLQEILAELPQARVLGLTATPPQTLTPDQAAVVTDLFGDVVYETTIPAVVREGDLAPFADLVWLTTPTPTETDYLDSEAVRFAELVTQVTDPAHGSTPFLEWIDARFRSGAFGWSTLSLNHPELADAALRLAHAGLLTLPEGARPREQHRREPTADDWVLLIEDWLTGALVATGQAEDQHLRARIQQALPSVGYRWTRHGIRRGRSLVDRVLARSLAKTTAAVALVTAEADTLGPRQRMLVLCDHEQASATVPVDLDGVIDAQAGSARAVLAALLADPTTRRLNPVLVTGTTVAANADTLARIRDQAIATDPALAGRLTLTTGMDFSELSHGWSSRQWVPVVTNFFAAGQCRVLVGTRGLLGEGWDARAITGLVDLTTATTPTAVVQTRGRALRTDPAWPDKVAINWSVVCVSDRHPRGDNDWFRLVRKHNGFFGVDDAGDVVDGVSHLDEAFSPYSSPDPQHYDSLNARMIRRSQQRAAIAERWQIGMSYHDTAVRSLWVRPAGGATSAPPQLSARQPTQVALRPDRLEDRLPAVAHAPRRERHLVRQGWILPPAGLLVALVAIAAGVPGPMATMAATIVAILGVLQLVRGEVERRNRVNRHLDGLLAEAHRPPGIGQVGCAIADALAEAGLVSGGAAQVRVELERGAEERWEYRCRLEGVSEADSATFVAALDEALGPIEQPRYLIPHWTPLPGADRHWARRALAGKVGAHGETWHAVPSILGTNAKRARSYARAWDTWIGGGDALYTGSPEGAGILAAVRGSDPFAVTSVMRRQWS